MKLARTDIDEAILKLLPILTNFMLSHHFSEELCLICNIGYDFILNERLEEMASAPKEDDSAEILSDEDFEKTFELALRNNVAIKSVPNIRSLDGFSTTDGRTVKNGMFLRSGSLSRLTPDDADYLQSVVRLSLVIDLRTTMEVKKDPDVKLHKILSVAPEEISSFLDDIESHYGSSSERIMKAIGFGEKELKTLRDKYLDSNIGDVWGRNDM